MKDLFSKQSELYARHRPTYPSALFPYLKALSPSATFAWDVGTGSGQAALELAREFDRVMATDLSANQIANMMEMPKNVTAFASPADPPSAKVQAALPDGQVSLVTVAQAIHWFDHPKFFAAAHCMLQPRGCVAFWCYALFKTGDKELDDLIHWLYDEQLGDKYWSPERKLVEEGYKSINVAEGFVEEAVDFGAIGEMTKTWSYDDLVGYLSTWSALGKFRDAHDGEYPWSDEWLQQVKELWGGPRTVTFDFAMRVFRKE